MVKIKIKMATDYFQIDELLTEEHKLVRQSVRDFVNQDIKPIIDEAAQQHKDIPV